MTRFEREARVLASLNHPNIATLHGFEREGDLGFLIMELVEGETLADRIASRPVPWRDAVPLFEAIADGLKAAHESGIVHRDLKPANVKIDREGRARILDFGLARSVLGEGGAAGAVGLTHSPTLTAPATLPGVLLGTAAYMSPEQARGLTVDRRADVWAFGCCLYEALTGRRAFEGEDVSLTLAAILSLSRTAAPPGGSASRARHAAAAMPREGRAPAPAGSGDARWSFAEARRGVEQRDHAGSTAPRARGRALTAVLAALALASMTAAAWLAITRPDQRRSFESEVGGPPLVSELDPGLAGVGTQVAVHPSGTSFVFSASDGLHRYDLADGVVRPISSSLPAQPPFLLFRRRVAASWRRSRS